MMRTLDQEYEDQMRRQIEKDAGRVFLVLLGVFGLLGALLFISRAAMQRFAEDPVEAAIGTLVGSVVPLVVIWYNESKSNG